MDAYFLVIKSTLTLFSKGGGSAILVEDMILDVLAHNNMCCR